MKKLLLSLLLLPSFLLSQSGDGYVNYTSYRTQCNNGCVFSRTVDGTSVQVNQHMSNTAEFDAAMTVISTSTAVSVLNSGETQAFSAGGFGTSVTSYNGGRPIGPGNTQGEYYIVDYTGWFYASSTGNYKFWTYSDDSHEFWLDLDGDDVLESTEMITKLYGGSGNNQSTNISLTSGTWYKLRVRFHEYTGGDWMRIQYQDPTNNGGSTWRILGDSTWGDKVSNAEPAPTFTNTVTTDGPNTIYYKVFSINGGDGTVGSHHPNNSSEFDVLFNTSTAGTEWTHQGRDTATKALTWPWPNILPRPNNGVWFGWEITGYFVPKETGNYEFKISSDDRSDLYLDTDLDSTLDQIVYYYEGTSRYEYTVSLTAGESYPFRVRYENGNGGANLYLKWTKPSDTVDNHTFDSDEIYSIDADDYVEPITYNVTYNLHSNITPSDFGVNTYYQSGTNEVTQNSNSTTVSLDSDGKANISDQIDEELTAGSNYKATPTDGGVEYMIVYDWDSNNQRHSVLIDKRMFNSFGYAGFADNAPTSLFQNVTALDLYDVFDGSLTYYQDDLYWAQYYIYTNITSNISNTSYSTKFRDTGSSNAVQIGSINFSAINNYKTQYVVFNEPSSTDLTSLAQSIITVADVYLAFQELTDRGINNNQSGNKFTHGIQYANANLDRDGDFDFNDTYLMLDWLNGGTAFNITGLSSVMRLIETSEYNSVASTDVGNYTTQTMFPLSLSTGTNSYTKNITVSWLGDVNMSHSPTPTNNLTVTGAPPPMYMTSEPVLIELYSETELKDGKVHVIVKTNNRGAGIGAIQLNLLYNNNILTLDSHNFNSDATDFINNQGGRISFGSLKTGEGSINNQSTYEFIFDTTDTTGSLGLVLVKPVEALTTNNEQVFIELQ